MKALRALPLVLCGFVAGFLVGALITWGDMGGAFYLGLAFAAVMAVVSLRGVGFEPLLAWYRESSTKRALLILCWIVASFVFYFLMGAFIGGPRVGGFVGLVMAAVAVLILFAIGAAGVFVRRNLITILLSIEIMLNAVNLTFVAFGRAMGSADGQIIVFFVMTVAAAEAAVGLAIVIGLFRHRESLNPDAFTTLKW